MLWLTRCNVIDKACLQITMELLGQRNVWEGNHIKVASVFSNKEASTKKLQASMGGPLSVRGVRLTRGFAWTNPTW